jgi:hypothetical protein
MFHCFSPAGAAFVRAEAESAGLGAPPAVPDGALPARASGAQLLRHPGARHGPRPHHPAAGVKPTNPPTHRLDSFELALISNQYTVAYLDSFELALISNQYTVAYLDSFELATLTQFGFVCLRGTCVCHLNKRTRYNHFNQSLEGCRLRPVFRTPHSMLGLFMIFNSGPNGHAEGIKDSHTRELMPADGITCSRMALHAHG